MSFLVIHFYVVFDSNDLFSSDSLVWFHYSISDMLFLSVPS